MHEHEPEEKLRGDASCRLFLRAPPLAPPGVLSVRQCWLQGERGLEQDPAKLPRKTICASALSSVGVRGRGWSILFVFIVVSRRRFWRAEWRGRVDLDSMAVSIGRTCRGCVQDNAPKSFRGLAHAGSFSCVFYGLPGTISSYPPSLRLRSAERSFWQAVTDGAAFIVCLRDVVLPSSLARTRLKESLFFCVSRPPHRTTLERLPHTLVPGKRSTGWRMAMARVVLMHFSRVSITHLSFSALHPFGRRAQRAAVPLEKPRG